GHDGRILHGPGANSPQGVPDGAALDLELSFRRQVLELTSTTEVAGIVRARGLDPARRWRLDRCQTRPSIPRLRLRHLDLDHIARRGPRHEDRAAIFQPPDPISSPGDALDRDPLHRSPRARAVRSQLLSGGRSPSALPGSVTPRSASAASAATTAIFSSSASVVARSRRVGPSRSKYPMSYFPATNSGSSRTEA